MDMSVPAMSLSMLPGTPDHRKVVLVQRQPAAQAAISTNDHQRFNPILMEATQAQPLALGSINSRQRAVCKIVPPR